MGLFTRSKVPSAPKQAPSTAQARSESDSSEPLALLGDSTLETRAQAIAGEILTAARSSSSGLLSAAFWSDKLMAWSMKDPAFKVQLFHFVDCFPALKSPEAIYDHLVDFMGQPGLSLPPGLDMGLKAGGLAKGIVARTMASQIESMAGKFIAGRDAKSALPDLERVWNAGSAFSVDLLGEACVSDEEATAYRAKYLDLISNLPAAVGRWKPNARLEGDHLGPIPRTNVSIKISSLYARTDPIDTEGSLRGLLDALEPILAKAHTNGVLVNFDMEHHSLKDLTLELFMRCCDRFPFTAGIAMQAYLRSGDADAQQIIDWSRKSGRTISVRLVKGAYWDSETILSEQAGWVSPVWARKRDTDACFERMAAKFVEATPRQSGQGGVKLAIGTHNARSIGAVMALVERAKLPHNALEVQMLYGMGDQIKAAVVARGMRLREYMPVGEMIPGMAYLVRRLLENKRIVAQVGLR